MQVEELKKLIDVASGRRKADLVIKNAEIVNVLTEEFIKADIAVCGDKIAGIGNYDGIKEIDASGLYAVPGLIDGHTHLEMSMLSVTEFARLVVPRGNTSVVADPHEIANVLGRDGIRVLIEEAKTTPLKVFFEVPSCVPSSPLETPGAIITAEDVAGILEWESVIGLAEVMNYPGVVNCDEDVLKKIAVAKAKGKIVDGHSPMLRGKELNAYISSGIGSDHECIDEEEAMEKLRLGMRLMIREGSAARNLESLLNVAKLGNRWTMLVTDGDRTIRDLMEKGYLDYCYRRAVEEGIDPIKALQMCTINPAEYFGINAGLIAPSRIADIVLLRNLEKFEVEKVIANGEVVGEIKRVYTYPDFVKSSVKLKKPITPEDIKIEGKGVARIIKVIEGEIVTGEDREYVEGVDVNRDILKIVVVERHKATGNVGKAYIRGFGLKRGAIAQSIAHDAHNIVAVGVRDEDICKAVNRIAELQGGIVVVDGDVKAELQLNIAGLMSEERAEVVAEKLDRIHEEIKRLGCKLKSPILALSFMALPVIPKLKVTDLGLVDVEEFKVVDVFVS
ncbi:adenine deaminase [Archaeoglobus profundus]|uniref:Adenine deaminase n=1 Tax=Archaeoglobus profundus (strain DSM 5631 / JCM 9629 / NBRC 100127 / Av18) TaxID=572546 RepID=D2REX0_ARCPA|nr:adenine deaminase [Archaeoglobus profundus]ADB58664.1 adenine deaminase [Archaeoglobus profundus DSM 5631]